MDIIKVFGFALTALIVYVLLKQYKPELAMLVAVGSCAIILVAALSAVLNSIFSLREILERAGVENVYFSVSFKALGISLVSRFAADACHDAGSTALESKVSFAGKCAVFAVSTPLLKGIAETAIGLVT